MTFDQAVDVVLEHEGFGQYVDDPADPGGATKWGISLRFLRSQGLELGDVDGDGDIDAADIKALTRARAIGLYRRAFWEEYRYDQLPGGVAGKVFDLSVNMGPRTAHRCLQRALRSVCTTVVEDGFLGPETWNRTEWACKTREGAVMAALRSEAAGVYRGLVIRNPTFDRFIDGWLNRAYS